MEIGNEFLISTVAEVTVSLAHQPSLPPVLGGLYAGCKARQCIVRLPLRIFSSYIEDYCIPDMLYRKRLGCGLHLSGFI